MAIFSNPIKPPSVPIPEEAYLIPLDITGDYLYALNRGKKPSIGEIILSRDGNRFFVENITDDTARLFILDSTPSASYISGFFHSTWIELLGERFISLTEKEAETDQLLLFLDQIEFNILDGTAYSLIIPSNPIIRGFFLSIWFFDYAYVFDNLDVNILKETEEYGVMDHVIMPIAPHITEIMTDTGIALTRTKVNTGTLDERNYDWDKLFVIFKFSTKPIYTEIPNPQSPFLYRVF